MSQALQQVSTAPAPCMPMSPAVAGTPDLFRQGMRRLAGACTIITSVAPGQGREGWAGMTATAVASVTADPARLLICVNRSTWAHGIISQSRILGVNVLGEAMRCRWPSALPAAYGLRKSSRKARG